MVVKLIYLIITRPNITYEIGMVSQHKHVPRQPHYKAIVVSFINWRVLLEKDGFASLLLLYLWQVLMMLTRLVVILIDGPLLAIILC